jgi:hypothetical protein
MLPTYLGSNRIVVWMALQSRGCSLHHYRPSVMTTHDNMPVAAPEPDQQRCAGLRLSSLEHVATFRNVLGNPLLTEVSESTYAEIFDGLPTVDSWNESHRWVAGRNPGAA